MTSNEGTTSKSDCFCDTSIGRVAVPEAYQTNGEVCGCGAGNYYSAALQTCTPCPERTTSHPGSTACALCSVGFYLYNIRLQPEKDGTDACLPCPAGAICEEGSTIETIRLLSGWWRLSSRTTDLRKCHGGSDSNDTSVDEARGCLGGGTVGACVDQNQTGPECRVCSLTNEYYDGDGRCLRCPDLGSRVLRALGWVLGAALLLTLLSVPLVSIRRVPSVCLPAANAYRGFVRGMMRFAKSIDLQPKLKVVISFYQVVIILDSTYSVTMPPVFTSWMNVFRLIGLDWSSFVIPKDCLARGVSSELLLHALAPVAVALAAFVSCALFEAIRAALKIRETGPKGLLRGSRKGALKAMPLALLITFMFVPSVSSRILTTFGSCAEYGDVDAVAQTGNGTFINRFVYFLRRDLSVRCYDSPEHEQAVQTALLMTFIWPVGVQLLYVALLAIVRRPLLNRTPTPLTRATAFLHRDYKPELFYWEAVDLARRLVLTGWVALVPEQKDFYRIVIAVLVSLAMLLLTLTLHPYRHSENQLLAVGSQFMLVVLFVGAGYIKAFEDTVDEVTSLGTDGVAFASSIYGFSSTESIVLMLLLFVLIMLIMFVAILVHHCVKAGHVTTIRSRATAKEPLLTLSTGQKFHLFNSHIWSTGQDATATIKRQLQRLMPTISVFLDVDDLKDIGSLERYIDESAVIMFFLSKGYFLSRNCLREVVATIEKKKPIVLVHEADPDKGGAPLEVLSTKECPPDLRPHVFPERREVTVWHRIADFQLVSLLEIACGMMAGLPAQGDMWNRGLRSSTELPLYVPRSLLDKRLAFPKKRVLYVSPKNPGSADVAAELLAAFPRGLTATSTAPAPQAIRRGSVQCVAPVAAPTAGPENPACSSSVTSSDGDTGAKDHAAGEGSSMGASLSSQQAASSPVNSRKSGLAETSQVKVEWAPTTDEPTHMLLYLNEHTVKPASAAFSAGSLVLQHGGVS